MEREAESVRLMDAGRLRAAYTSPLNTECFSSVASDKFQVLAHGNHYGLTFVTSVSGFVVTTHAQYTDGCNDYVSRKQSAIDRGHSAMHVDVEALTSQTNVTLPAIAYHLSLSPDELHLAVAYKDCLALFEVAALLQSTSPTPYHTFTDLVVEEMAWSPVQIDSGEYRFAVLTHAKSVLICSTDCSKEDVPLGTTSATAVAWSPTGESIAIGTDAGSVEIFSVSPLAAERSIARPGCCDEGFQAHHINWAEDDVFLVGYKLFDAEENETKAQACLFEAGECVELEELVAFYDVEGRKHQYYSVFLADWRMFFIGCSLSADIELLVADPDSGEWEIWKPAERYQARLPMNSDDDETYPLGLTLNLNAHKDVEVEEAKYPPPVIVSVATTDGLLVSFSFLDLSVNVALPFVRPPEVFVEIPTRAQSPSTPAAPVSAPIQAQQPVARTTTSDVENVMADEDSDDYEDLEEEKEEERQSARNVFDEIDAASSGVIDKSRFGDLLEVLGTTYCEPNHAKYAKRLADESGMITKDDFVAWYADWVFGDNESDDEDEEAPAETPSTGGGANALAKFAVKEGSWRCDVCLVNNPNADAEKCVSCESPNPAFKGKPLPAFGSTTTASNFTFGVPAGTTVTQAPPTTSFSFGGVSTPVPVTTATAGWSFGSSPKTEEVKEDKPTAFTGAFKFGVSSDQTNAPKPAAEVASGFKFGVSEPAAKSAPAESATPAPATTKKQESGYGQNDENEFCPSDGEDTDDEEERKEEEENAREAFKKVAAGSDTIPISKFPALIKALGSTYDEDDHGKVCESLTKNGQVHVEDVVKWYLAWIFDDGESSDEEEEDNKATTAANAEPEMKSAAQIQAAFSRFAPKEGAWKCDVCMVTNSDKGAPKCSSCESPNPNAPKQSPFTASASSSVAAGSIGAGGFAFPAAAQTKTEAVSSGFSFGLTDPASSAPPSFAGGFNFGAGNTAGLSFGKTESGSASGTGFTFNKSEEPAKPVASAYPPSTTNRPPPPPPPGASAKPPASSAYPPSTVNKPLPPPPPGAAKPATSSVYPPSTISKPLPPPPPGAIATPKPTASAYPPSTVNKPPPPPPPGATAVVKPAASSAYPPSTFNKPPPPPPPGATAAAKPASSAYPPSTIGKPLPPPPPGAAPKPASSSSAYPPSTFNKPPPPPPPGATAAAKPAASSAYPPSTFTKPLPPPPPGATGSGASAVKPQPASAASGFSLGGSSSSDSSFSFGPFGSSLLGGDGQKKDGSSGFSFGGATTSDMKPAPFGLPTKTSPVLTTQKSPFGVVPSSSGTTAPAFPGGLGSGSAGAPFSGSFGQTASVQKSATGVTKSEPSQPAQAKTFTAAPPAPAPSRPGETIGSITLPSEKPFRDAVQPSRGTASSVLEAQLWKLIVDFDRAFRRVNHTTKTLWSGDTKFHAKYHEEVKELQNSVAAACKEVEALDQTRDQIERDVLFVIGSDGDVHEQLEYGREILASFKNEKLKRLLEEQPLDQRSEDTRKMIQDKLAAVEAACDDLDKHITSTTNLNPRSLLGAPAVGGGAAAVTTAHLFRALKQTYESSKLQFNRVTELAQQLDGLSVVDKKPHAHGLGGFVPPPRSVVKTKSEMAASITQADERCRNVRRSFLAMCNNAVTPRDVFSTPRRKAPAPGPPSPMDKAVSRLMPRAQVTVASPMSTKSSSTSLSFKGTPVKSGSKLFALAEDKAAPKEAKSFISAPPKKETKSPVRLAPQRPSIPSFGSDENSVARSHTEAPPAKKTLSFAEPPARSTGKRSPDVLSAKKTLSFADVEPPKTEARGSVGSSDTTNLFAPKPKPSVSFQVPEKTPAPGSTGVDYKERLVTFYKEHNPAKVNDVDQTLKDFQGKEETMFKRLFTKYLPSATDDDVHKFLRGGPVPKKQATAPSAFGSAFGGQKLANAAPSIPAIKSPAGPTPSASPFGKPAVSSPFGKSPFTLGGTVAHTPMPTAPVAFGTPVVNPYKQRLIDFYQKHNPTKLGDVDTTLEKYKGNEEKLFQNLAIKYKVNEAGAATSTGPFGAPSVPKSPAASPFGNTSSFSSISLGGQQSAPGFGSTSSLGFGSQAAPAVSSSSFVTSPPDSNAFRSIGFEKQQPAFGSTATLGGGAGASPFGTSPFGGQPAVNYKEKLIQFYQKYNPEKLSTVDATLEKYKGQENKLFQMLEQKYLHTPTAPVASGGSAFGGAASSAFGGGASPAPAFGGGASPAPAFGGGSAFGAPSALGSASASPSFGAPSSLGGASAAPAFGSSSTLGGGGGGFGNRFAPAAPAASPPAAGGGFGAFSSQPASFGSFSNAGNQGGFGTSTGGFGSGGGFTGGFGTR